MDRLYDFVERQPFQVLEVRDERYAIVNPGRYLHSLRSVDMTILYLANTTLSESYISYAIPSSVVNTLGNISAASSRKGSNSRYFEE